MNSKIWKRNGRVLVLVLAALAIVVAPSFAQITTEVNLAAVEATATMPDGATIPMWMYINDPGSCPAAAADWNTTWQTSPPISTAGAGDTLTINLRNCLSEPVSVFVPGQAKATSPVTFADAQGRTRVRSFDAQTAPGSVGIYTWNNIKPGTYLLHSGTHPQKQVQMGLYGAVVVGNNGMPDITLVYSEIDPVLHAAVAGGSYGTAAYPSTFDYKPKYYLINGDAYPDGADIAVNISEDVLFRFVNAGLKTHVPTLQGLYMTVLGEDGNPYPYPQQQYGIELTAGKTMDAVVNAGTAGRYALYDRGLRLTNGPASGGGMLTYIQAGTVAGAPTAADDSYSLVEDGSLTTVAGGAGNIPPDPPGVLDNDSGGAAAAVLVSGPSAGTLGGGLGADGSFTYTPNSNFNGIDLFSYVANDGLGGPNSNVATVTITVTPDNDAPVALADAYDAVEGQTLSVAVPGVLANDSDIDGDGLTAAAFGTPPPGTLLLNPDGSFDYTPAGAAGASEAFQYVANDGTVDSPPATVTITVTGAVANVAPFANDDFAQTQRNTEVTFSVTANDVDADGTIDVTTVVLVNGSATQGGGTVVENNDGTVTYTPKRGFRGTDLFSYTVNDNDGATSNAATVRVNVTR